MGRGLLGKQVAGVCVCVEGMGPGTERDISVHLSPSGARLVPTSGHQSPTRIRSPHFHRLLCFCLMMTAQPHPSYTCHF